MHRTPRLLLAVLVLLALALGACGGDDISSKSARDVLKETFGPDKPIDSGKIDLRIAFDAKGLEGVSGPLKLALKGPFATAGKGKLPTFDFDVTVDVSGQALQAGAVATDEKAWLKFGGQDFAVDAAQYDQFRKSYEADQKKAAESDDASFQALGVDPTRWLAEPRKAEAETVGGAETVHVTSKVDVPKLLEDVNKLLGRADATGAAAAAGAGGVPSKLTDEQRAQIERSVKSTSLDVYSGADDGTLRRLNIQVFFDVPEDARKDAGGLTSGRLALDLVLTELNEEQEITAPKDARPLSDLTRGTTGVTGPNQATEPSGGVFGTDAQPETGGEAAPEAGGAAAPGAPNPEYTACLDAAGASIAEVQKCAPLLAGP